MLGQPVCCTGTEISFYYLKCKSNEKINNTHDLMESCKVMSKCTKISLPKQTKCKKCIFVNNNRHFQAKKIQRKYF